MKTALSRFGRRLPDFSVIDDWGGGPDSIMS